MITLPVDDTGIMTIVGIDPGSNTLGIASIHVEYSTGRIVAVNASTLCGERLAKRRLDGLEYFSDKHIRIHALKRMLVHLFNIIKPNVVVSESPFYSKKRPSAFGVLTEVICSIEQALEEYDPGMLLRSVDPPTAKAAVGAVMVKGGDKKEPVRKAVLELKLPYIGLIPIERLSEHAIDAIAIAYSRYKIIFSGV